MDNRKENLLKAIIEVYIKEATPVGSKLLADNANFGVSPATLRNEMLALEKEGYLTHPHTSAGRVPTEMGYKYYFLNLNPQKNIKKSEKEFLAKIGRQVKTDPERGTKLLGKAVAELAQGAVLVSFGRDNVYYTGLSYLFSQPEFFEHSLVYDLSEVIDQLDEVLDEIFEKFPDNELQVSIGILGPMRMDYFSNFARLEYMRELSLK
jgi:transcriptional regulator of heat shock response